MCDENDGSVGETCPAVLDEGDFASGIKHGGRFIQHKDRRVFEQGTGQGDALALASRKANSVITDQSVIILRQSDNEFVSLGEARGLLDLVACGVHLSETDVVADTAIEE